MTGKTLPIRHDVLENPTRLDLAEIEAWMLWPDDAERRERALAAASVESIAQEQIWSPELGKRAFELARNAPSISDIHTEVRKGRFLRGAIVGSVLHNVIYVTHGLCLETTMEEQIENAIEPFKLTNNGGIARLSVKTFQNKIWPIFRCVAHLWAASFKSCKLENQPFPCHINNLRTFLLDAEAYRIFAENTHIKHATPPVLNPGETIKIPHQLGLIPTGLSFGDAPLK